MYVIINWGIINKIPSYNNIVFVLDYNTIEGKLQFLHFCHVNNNMLCLLTALQTMTSNSPSPSSPANNSSSKMRAVVWHLRIFPLSLYGPTFRTHTKNVTGHRKKPPPYKNVRGSYKKCMAPYKFVWRKILRGSGSLLAVSSAVSFSCLLFSYQTHQQCLLKMNPTLVCWASLWDLCGDVVVLIVCCCSFFL